MAINVKGIFLTFRAFFLLMKSAGASVVNVSSVQAVRTLPDSVAYVTSKHAIAGLTRALAVDHAQDNIRVHCVSPGAVDTPMFRSSVQNMEDLASLLQEIAHLHALGRIARPEEVAKLIALLRSDDASFTARRSLAGGRRNDGVGSRQTARETDGTSSGVLTRVLHCSRPSQRASRLCRYNKKAAADNQEIPAAHSRTV